MLTIARPRKKPVTRDLTTEHFGDEEELLRQVGRELDVRRVGPDLWHDIASDEGLTTADVVDRYQDHPAIMKLAAGALDGLDQYVGGNRVHLIETQRLIGRAPTPMSETRYAGARRRPPETRRSTVEAFSRDLASRLTDSLAISGQLSQRLDRTFPNRVLQRGQDPLSNDEIVRRYQDQMDYRNRLTKIGVLDEEVEVELTDTDLDTTERRVMQTYLSDVDEKRA